MPAFDANDAYAASFCDFLAPWLADRRGELTPAIFAQLHYALDGIEYHILTDRSGIGPLSSAPPPRYTNVKCSFHDCLATSTDHDACIGNYSPIGYEPLWLCRRHPPRVSGLQPPSWTPPNEDERHALTLAAWRKLTPAERTALNRNIVAGVEPSSHD